MTKRQMMVEAHRIAREELKGDYQARLSLALRQLWKKKKGEDKMIIVEQNLKDCYVKVDGEVLIEGDFLVVNNIGSRDGFAREEMIDNPKDWLFIYEVTEERFEEVISGIEQLDEYLEAKKEANSTGERAKYYAYTEDCTNPKEQCDIDKVFVYVTPEGKIERERIHTC